jgi:radical SAM protein with 4Fe4S-binding SPASM domain
MCVHGTPELKKKFNYKEHLSTLDIKGILLEGRRYRCPSISFQGDNESFLIRELPLWFRMARDHGFMDIMVNTNGSIMSEHLAEEICTSGLTRLRFSLDAVKKSTYEKIRIGGDFDKVVSNIELFLETRGTRQIPKVGLNFLKMKSNESEIDEFIDTWNDRVDYIVFQDYFAPDTISSGYISKFAASDFPEVGRFRCPQPWQRVYIRGNGDVVPCCAMFGSYMKVGNVHEKSIHDIWNSPKYKYMRKIHKNYEYHKNMFCFRCSKAGVK